MSNQELYIEQFGRKAWENLGPRLKNLLIATDSLALAQKPIPRKLLEKALS